MQRKKLWTDEQIRDWEMSKIPDMCVSCDEVREMFDDKLINLTDEQIKSTWIDYCRIAKGYTMDNPITCINSFDEGTIRSYDTVRTIKYIKDYFDLPDEFIRKLVKNGGVEQIWVNIPIVGDNLKFFKKVMNFCGYYLVSPMGDTLEQNTYCWLQFEKIFQKDDSEQIKIEEEFLYYITVKSNIGKIKHIGFSPRDKHELYNYPERVYFLRGSTDKDIIKNLIHELSDNNHNKGNRGQYVIMTIEIPNHPLYIDENCVGGIFTRDNISPDIIINIKDIKFENGKVQSW